MEWIKLIAVVGAVVAMLYGLYEVFARLKAKGQGFGPGALKAVGLVLFVPSLVILALATDFKTETLGWAPRHRCRVCPLSGQD